MHPYFSDIEAVSKAFHDARVVGEQLLEKGQLRWTDYAEMMIGFELTLKEMGVDL